MKALSVILKVLETIVVCIWGAACGIFLPIFISVIGENVFPANIVSNTELLIIWTATGVIYVLSAALIFGKHYRIAAILSFVGFIGVLMIHSIFYNIPHADTGSSKTESLYLPLILATLFDIFILVIEERDNIKKLLEKRRNADEEQAPSILADSDDTAGKGRPRTIDTVIDVLRIVRVGNGYSELICPKENVFKFNGDCKFIYNYRLQ